MRLRASLKSPRRQALFSRERAALADGDEYLSFVFVAQWRNRWWHKSLHKGPQKKSASTEALKLAPRLELRGLQTPTRTSVVKAMVSECA
jgi:hypothetical protein